MLKSERTLEKAFISFVNYTSKTIDAIWHDYNGNMVRYGTLRPGELLDVDTFSQHPWRGFDIVTGKGILLNGESVFYPLSVREIRQRFQMVHMPLKPFRRQRSSVNISVPLTTLTELCHEIVMRRINSNREIDLLEIPELLKCNLRQTLTRKKDYMNNVIDYTHF